MPGRGRPWKGVGEGNPDRIGTGAIADGSITEADLNSALQSKVNGGGGAWEKIGEDKLTVAGTTMTVTPSTSITEGTVNQLLIIANFQLNVDGTCLIDVGGSGGTFNNRGVQSDGTTVSAITRGGASNFGSGLDFDATRGNTMKCDLFFNDNNGSNILVDTRENSQAGTQYRSLSSVVDSNTSAITVINAVTNQNFAIGSSLSVYKLKI